MTPDTLTLPSMAGQEAVVSMKEDRKHLFGAELRRRRAIAGLSLAELARAVNYSKSHLSKIENSAKSPSTALARQCDRALGAGGALVRIASPPPVAIDDSQPLPAAGPDIDANFLAYRSLSRLGSAAELDLAAFESMLHEIRRLGQTAGPAAVMALSAPASRVLASLALDAPRPSQAAGLRLAARFAEYTRWMAQERDDAAGALWWTRQAVALATAGGTRGMAGYALVRRAELALYREDSVAVLALARRAQEAASSNRVLALAIHREAQGHALASDEIACRRALDRADEFLRQPADNGSGGGCDGPGGEQLGSATMIDQTAFVTGWCLQDLGHSEEAAAILGAEFARIPAHAHRVRARYGARLALALAGQRDLPGVCSLAATVVDSARLVDSATVRCDLRLLVRSLARWRGHPRVRQVLPDLATVVHT